MSEKKIIAVIGATGAQGGGLVRAILNDPESQFGVRAITRNANSDKAKALASMGAEVVEANSDDKNSLVSAFKGAYGVYGVTFFWEHFSPEKEISQVEKMAGAAKETGVKHFIWSTLEDTRNWVPLDDDRMPTLMGKYKVPHFDSKGSSDHIFTDYGVPTTNLLTSFYWENLIYFDMGPKREVNGSLSFPLPMADKKLPGIAAKDIGGCALGIFKRGDDYIGKTVGISGGHLTGKQMAESLSKLHGEPVGYFPIPHDVYRTFEFPGAEDIGNMMQFKCDFEDYYCGVRNLDESRTLNASLQSFDEWLEEHKSMLAIK
jgi:uncharacterized protein YbjT (DUF2867 family)